jgi:inhibitor of KinA sporulation pathway (predicted exonuclease)
MAKNLLDVITIVDVEATCHPRGEEPPDFLSEIIQIGLAFYNVTTREITQGGGVMIRPTQEISTFCTELTGITFRDVEYAETLQDAVPSLMANFWTNRRPWLSYGDYDRVQFERECLEKDIPYPFGRRHINVKTLLAVKEGWTKEVGMDEALRQLGMPLIGKHHDAGDDAFNIAQIARYVFGRNRV